MKPTLELEGFWTGLTKPYGPVRRNFAGKNKEIRAYRWGRGAQWGRKVRMLFHNGFFWCMVALVIAMFAYSAWVDEHVGRCFGPDKPAYCYPPKD